MSKGRYTTSHYPDLQNKLRVIKDALRMNMKEVSRLADIPLGSYVQAETYGIITRKNKRKVDKWIEKNRNIFLNREDE